MAGFGAMYHHQNGYGKEHTCISYATQHTFGQSVSALVCLARHWHHGSWKASQIGSRQSNGRKHWATSNPFNSKRLPLRIVPSAISRAIITSISRSAPPGSNLHIDFSACCIDDIHSCTTHSFDRHQIVLGTRLSCLSIPRYRYRGRQ